MANEVESIRSALRGRRLDVLAAQLCIPIPTLETFVHGRAGLAPALLASSARILARLQNIPAAIPRNNTMKLTARAVKCTLMLNASELTDPGSSTRAMLEISVGGKIFTADIASKSVRKCRAVIAKHGADCVLLI